MKDIRVRLLLLKGSRSIKEFASLLDLPVSTVYYYMNGRIPSLSFVSRVCKRLNVREEWLLNGNGPIFREVTEKDTLNYILEYLRENWDRWGEKKRHWFELHFRQIFPEFEEWLLRRGPGNPSE